MNDKNTRRTKLKVLTQITSNTYQHTHTNKDLKCITEPQLKEPQRKATITKKNTHQRAHQKNKHLHLRPKTHCHNPIPLTQTLKIHAGNEQKTQYTPDPSQKRPNTSHKTIHEISDKTALAKLLNLDQDQPRKSTPNYK